MMNRGVMDRQMFNKGGAAGFPDVSGDGKITQKDILMARGVEFKQEGGPAGKVPTDVQAIFNGLVNAMRGSEEDVARYVAQNQTDLIDIAKMFPGTAPTIEAGFGTLMKKATGPAMTAFSSEMVPSPPMMADTPGAAASTIDPYMYGGISRPVQDAVSGALTGSMTGMTGRATREAQEGLRGMTGPGESVTESPLTTEEGGRFNVYPPTEMQMGGEPMAAAMEQGNMAPAPMAAPPMPANLGPAEMDGIASQVNPEVLAMLQGAARSFGDPEQAESFEDMMNMVRGVPATEEERRQELAGVVGPSDAQQTPDSVLALLQPTMLLMDSPETEVDTGGIGPMAQTAMDVPVQGNMAEGIMSMAAPESEGASPPVNFNQGGEVLRFSKGMAVPGGPSFTTGRPRILPTRPGIPSSVTPDFRSVARPKRAAIAAPTVKSPTTTAPTMSDFSQGVYAPTKTLRELYQERLPLLEEITAAGKDNTAAQIQFFSDLAKAGAAFAQPTAPGQSVVSKLAQSLSESGISENAAKLAASRAATEQALKLKAFEGAEREAVAEQAARRESKLIQQRQLGAAVNALKERTFKFKQSQNAFEFDKYLQNSKAALDEAQTVLQTQLQFMSKAEGQRAQAIIDQKLLEYQEAFKKNTAELAHQRNLQTLGFKQVYDLEKIVKEGDIRGTLQDENNKAAAKLAKLRDERAAIQKNLDRSQQQAQFETTTFLKEQQNKRINEIKQEELAIKRHASDLKSLAAKTKAYKTPGESSSVLLNDTFVPTGATQPMQFLPAWAGGQISATDTRSKQLATMLDNAVKGTVSWDQTGGPDGTGAYVKSTYKFSPRELKGILKRASLPDSDLSADVKEFARLSLMADDPDAMEREIQTAEDNAKISGMWTSLGKILSPGMQSSNDPTVLRKLAEDTAAKAAFDVSKALGLGGLVDRTISKGFALIGEDYGEGNPAERGFFITQRLFVDGLTSAMANMAGKENKAIQERLAKVTPTEVLETTSVGAYIDKSNTYLGHLATAIEAQEAALRGGLDFKERQQGLIALGKMQRTYHTINDLVKALDIYRGSDN